MYIYNTTHTRDGVLARWCRAYEHGMTAFGWTSDVERGRGWARPTAEVSDDCIRA